MRFLVYLKIICLSILITSISPVKGNAQDSVKLSGATEVLKNRITIVKDGVFIGRMVAEPELFVQTSDAGKFNFSFELKHPEILTFQAWYKNWFIYFKPGDSLTFKITGSMYDQKLTFSGRGEARCNLFAMVSEIEDKAPEYYKYKDFVKYKMALNDWLAKSQLIVKDYTTIHPVDDESVYLIANKLKYRYVRMIYDTKDELGTKPENYFLEANAFSINQDKLIHLLEYRAAIFKKFIPARKQENSVSDLEPVYKEIVSKLKGKTLDFALANLTGEYVLKQSTKDASLLKKIFNSLYKKKLDSTYLSYLKESEMRYFIIGKPLPDQVLNKTMFTDYTNDNKESLAQILNQHRNKPVYIDLWASWCKPCRDDIANSTEGKKLLSDKNITYLYFSTDTDKRAWRKAAAQDQITEHQYVFNNDSKKEFNTFIELAGIPRYIFLDKNHNVKTLFAPRPTAYFEKDFRRIVLELVTN